MTSTYNDETGEVGTCPTCYVTYPPGGRTVLAGYSNLGYSVSTNGGSSFTYQPGPKTRPPNFGQTGGWDALWGDPSITNGRGYGQYVYIANLAVSHQSFPYVGNTDKRTGGPGGGSIQGDVEWDSQSFPLTCPVTCGQSDCECSYIDGACIARSTDFGVHFNPIPTSDCFTHNHHFYDGSAMTATNSGAIYAAFNDVTLSAEDVWYAPNPTASLSLITPGPFAGLLMTTHPVLRYDYINDRIYILAMGCTAGDPNCPAFHQDSGQATGKLFIDYWNGSAWHGPLTLPTSNAVFAPWIRRGNVAGQAANVRTGQPYSFDIGTASVNQNDDIRIVYTDLRTNGLVELNTIICTRALGASCQIVGGWNTGVYSGQQFNPSVITQPGFLGVAPVWKVSYNTTELDVNGSTLSLVHTTLSVNPNNGQHIPWTWNALVTNTPLCPDTRKVTINGSPTVEGYWGDYDDLKILSVTADGGITTFIRTNTDSTGSQCSRDTYTSAPVHVSAETCQ